MVLNQQTNAFPPIDTPDRGWDRNVEAALLQQIPQPGAIVGLEIGIPLDLDGAVDTGLMPRMTDGTLIWGSAVLEVRHKNVVPAPANAMTRKLFYGLSGAYFADAANVVATERDAELAQITTNNADPASIVSTGQLRALGGGKYAIRAELNVGSATDGADTVLYTWVPSPHFKEVRLLFAKAKVLVPTTAAGDAGDDVVGKVKFGDAAAIALVTLDDAVMNVEGSSTRFAAADDDAVDGSTATPIQLIYNVTDNAAAANYEGGVVEFYAEFQCY